MANSEHLQRAAQKRAKKKPLSRVAGQIHEGGLHQTLGVSQSQKLSQADIARAKAMGGKAAKQANLAQTFAKYRPRKKHDRS